MKRKVYGIIGLLGSGKSEVLKIMKNLGLEVIDSDEIVHEIYKPENIGWQKIVNFFGDEYLTKKGEINRKKLLAEVLKKPQKLEILNKLIHPLVINEIIKKIDKIERNETVFVEIPVYIEKLFKNIIYKTIKIEADKEKILKRICKSRKNYENYKKLLLLQQKSFKLRPDYTIFNRGSVNDLKRQVKLFLKNSKN
jgi:dephospho-CoA kinase